MIRNLARLALCLSVLIFAGTLRGHAAALPISVDGGWTSFLCSETVNSYSLLGPFTFTSTTQAVLTVVDTGGDYERYSAYDFANLLGSTSLPARDGASASSPDSALTSFNWSSGRFPISPGSHSIYIMIIQTGPGDTSGFATGFLRVDTAPVPAAPPPIRFSPATNFNVGVNPVFISTGDFNRDGNIDLVTANDSTSDLTILLGDGTGQFTFKTNYVIGTVPQSVAVGDFDGDGIPDLVATRVYGNQSIIYKGLGDGTFTGPTYQAFNASAAGGGLVVGDFNNDHKLDFVVTVSPVGFSVSLGRGDGTFSNAVPQFKNSDKSVAVGDFNNDGKLDIAQPYQSGKLVSISLGHGDGTFGTPTNFSIAPAFPQSGLNTLAVGDLNHDGNLDIVSVNQGSTNSLTILLGDGTGAFTVKTNYGLGAGPACVALADLNRDGNLDIVAGSTVLLGKGDGTFGAPVGFPTANGPMALALVDVNHDGLPDMVTANAYGTVSVLLNQSYPKLQIAPVGGQYSLAWPSFFDGYQLQSSTNCAIPGSWTLVANLPVVVGSQNVVSDVTGGPFYRLKK